MTTSQINLNSQSIEPPQEKCNQPNWLIVAFAVGGVAGIVILTLGGCQIFGSVGSIGFIASLSSGGLLVCLAIGGSIWLVVSNCKDEVKKNDREPPPIEKNNQEPAVHAADLDIEDANKLKEKEKEKSVEELASKEEKPNTPLFDEKAEEKKYVEKRQSLINAIHARMAKNPLPLFELPDDAPSDFVNHARDAMKFSCRIPPVDSHIKRFAGGVHACVTTTKIPGILFKQSLGASYTKDLKEPQEYVTRAEKARKICQDNGLYLLYVPQSKVSNIDPTFVMEELMDLAGKDRESSKSFYEWAMHDQQLQPYCKELLRQLTIFTCLMGMADIKYDNIPWTLDGRLALIDLDDEHEHGSIKGLTEGLAVRNGGIFNLVPLEWFDELVSLAKLHLKADDFEELQKRLPDLRAKAEKRQASCVKKAQFYAAHNIKLPTTPIVFDKKLFKDYAPEIVFIAEKIVAELNHEIPLLPHLSMIAGRKTTFKVNTQDPLYMKIANEPLWKSKNANHWAFTDCLPKAMKALQEQGYVISFKYYESTYQLSIVF